MYLFATYFGSLNKLGMFKETNVVSVDVRRVYNDGIKFIKQLLIVIFSLCKLVKE